MNFYPTSSTHEIDIAGYVKTYIILPPMVYGIASGPLVDAGIQNPRSRRLPGLVKVCLDRKQGGMVGEGRNYWGNFYIDDSEFYAVMYLVK